MVLRLIPTIADREGGLLLYVATNLNTLERPNDGSLAVWVRVAPDPGASAWRLYYRFSPRVFAWLLRECDKRERQMLAAPNEFEQAALLQRCHAIAAKLEPLFEFANARFTPGKLAVAIKKGGAGLPESEFKVDEVALEILTDQVVA